MDLEKTVAEHYESAGTAERIIAQAQRGADDPDRLSVADLSAYDEMHIGGRRATEYLLAALGPTPGMRVLDIGSGIGGPARVAADLYGVHVTGIDLTPGFREVAQTLSAAVGIGEDVNFVTGNALAMPFGEAMFDAAYMVHAGMNIRDKAAVYGEASRVLKQGAVFGVYDVMAGDNAPALTYPVPWAQGPETSFLIRPQEVTGLLRDAGFQIIAQEDRSEAGLEALMKLQQHESFKARGDGYARKIANLVLNIQEGRCAPWQILARRV